MPIITYGRTTMRQFALNIGRYLSIDSEKGVTAIEYGLIASLVAVAIIISITLLGTNLAATFNFVAGKMKSS